MRTASVRAQSSVLCVACGILHGEFVGPLLGLASQLFRQPLGGQRKMHASQFAARAFADVQFVQH